MLEDTTYVTLEQAAKIIESDIDSILNAALEGRVLLYWPLHQEMEAELVGAEGGNDDSNPRFLNKLYSEYKSFEFVPIARAALSTIMNKGFADVTHDPLTLPDEHEYYWRAVQGNKRSTLFLEGLENIFLLRSDCVACKKLMRASKHESSEVTQTPQIDEAACIPPNKTKHTGSPTRWNDEALDELIKYDATHTTIETKQKFGISRQRIAKLVKKEKLVPTANNPFGNTKTR